MSCAALEAIADHRRRSRVSLSGSARGNARGEGESAAEAPFSERTLRAILGPTVPLPGAALFELARVVDLKAMGEAPRTPGVLPKLEPREAKVRIAHRDQGEAMLIYSEGFM